MPTIILPVIDTDTIGWTFDIPTDAQASVLVKASVTTTSTTLGGGIQLKGDVTSPGNSKYYGTDASGVKGWNAFSGLTSAVTGLHVQGNALLTGDVTLIQGANVTLSQSGQNITIASSGGAAVTGLHVQGNTLLTGDVVLVQGSNVTLTQSGQNITIASSGGGGGGGSGSGSSPVRAQVSGIAAAIPSGTTTAFQWSTVNQDEDAMVDLGAHPTRITINTAGKVVISATLQCEANGTGARIVELWKNGSAIAASSNVITNPTDPRINVGWNDSAIVGDYYEIALFQSSGSNNTPTNAKFAVTVLGGGSQVFSGAKVIRTTDQTISNNTATAISFDSEIFDTDNYHDNSTNPTRLTVPRAGYYRATAIVRMADGSNTTDFYLTISKNGSQLASVTSAKSTVFNDNRAELSAIFQLAAGDYLEAGVYQSAGGNRTVVHDAGEGPTFSIEMVGVAGGVGDLLDFQFVRKTADETVSGSTTLQDDDALVLSIGASETWIIDYTLFVDASTAGDIKFAPAVPASASWFLSCIGTDTGVSADAVSPGRFQGLIGSGVGAAGGMGVGSSSGFSVVRLKLLVVNSTNAGNVVLQWAQLSSSGSTIVKAGSWLEARRVG